MSKELNIVHITNCDRVHGNLLSIACTPEEFRNYIKSQREEAVREFVRLFHESTTKTNFVDKYGEYDKTNDPPINYHRYIDDLLKQFIADENKDETTEDEIKSRIKELTGEEVEDVLGNGYEEYSAMDETTSDKWRSQGYVEGGKDGNK